MTPKDRYGLQIAATIFGIIGTVLLWWALWVGSWTKTDTTNVDVKFGRLGDLTLQKFHSRGLFSRCTTRNHIELLSTGVDDLSCCSTYSSRDFDHHSSWTRIQALQLTGLFGTLAASISAILLFSSMCHMGAKPRQDVRWAALAFGLTAFVLTTLTISLYAKWAKDVDKKDKRFSSGAPASGSGLFGAGIFYVGLAAIMIGISTHKASLVN